MKRYLLYIVLTVVLSTAGCTRGQWLDEVVAQRDEQEDVVPILEAAKEKGLTVDSAEEIERTNKYYTGNSNNEEFKRYRIVFSDQTTVEFDVLGQLNGVQSDYYAERGLSYISGVQLSDIYVSVMLANCLVDGFVFLNTSPNAPKTGKIYYTSTDGQVVTPGDTTTTAFGANIVSNTYENGQGVITFDGNVTKIGDNAFYYCSSLASITIPNSVTSIGEYAFSGCSSLVSITIPEGVTSIGWGAFCECSSLASITIPESVISIGNSAFWCCTSLASITIPEGVTSIGDNAFYNCDSLTSVTIGNRVTSIGYSAFDGCTGLTSITIPDGVTSIGYKAFYNCSSLASITIPDSVTEIGEYAFYNCSSLAEVYCKPTTPPTAYLSVYSSWNAFGDNASGRKIYVPEESVEAYKTAEWWSKYADAFVPYDFLKNRKIYYTSTDGNVVTPYATNVFGANIVSNTYENGKGVITFDGNVTKIGEYAFQSCSKLASITIPESVTSIGNGAFWGCQSLVSITIPNSVNTMGVNPFPYCYGIAEFKGKFASEDGKCLIVDGVLNSFAIGCGLTEYTIPEGVTSIGYRAFGDCSSLASITISEGVTSIGRSAFYACRKLAEVYCKSAAPPTAIEESYWDAFDYNASGRKIYVPAESVEAYKTADGWSEYADAFVPYDFEKGEVVNLESRKIYYTSTDGNVVTPYYSGTSYFGAHIVSNTYENGQGVITFDGEVTSIGSYAFYDCSSLASVTIPDSVTSIGNSVFDGCSSLASITIPDSVTSIGYRAFYNCSSLASITIPDGVTSIGGYAFAYCSILASITIPDGVTSIGDYAFSGCSSLANITIPDGVTSIGDYAFDGCSSLASITIPDSVTSIGYHAFADCSSLASITIPEGVTEIRSQTFQGCTSLASITIPEGVTSIGSYAFFGCSSLASITIPDSVNSIGDYAFFGCTSLASITLPESLTSLGYIAFAYCHSLKEVYCKAITPPTAIIPDSSSKWGAFDYNASGRKIYVPTESVEAYKTAEWWSKYADAIEPYVFE